MNRAKPPTRALSAAPAYVPLSVQEVTDEWEKHIIRVFDKNGINPIVFARAIESLVVARMKGTP